MANNAFLMECYSSDIMSEMREWSSMLPKIENFSSRHLLQEGGVNRNNYRENVNKRKCGSISRTYFLLTQLSYNPGQKLLGYLCFYAPKNARKKYVLIIRKTLLAPPAPQINVKTNGSFSECSLRLQSTLKRGGGKGGLV